VDEPGEAVEDHAVDDTVVEVGQELAELGAQDDPVDGAVRLDDLALLEGRGVVLPVDLDEAAPVQSDPGVFGVFELAVHAGFDTEAVGGDAQVGTWALGGVGRQVVVEVEGGLSAAGMGGGLDVLPDGGAADVTVSAPGTRWLRCQALSVALRGRVVPWIRCRIRGSPCGY